MPEVSVLPFFCFSGKKLFPNGKMHIITKTQPLLKRIRYFIKYY